MPRTTPQLQTMATDAVKDVFQRSIEENDIQKVNELLENIPPVKLKKLLLESNCLVVAVVYGFSDLVAALLGVVEQISSGLTRARSHGV